MKYKGYARLFEIHVFVAIFWLPLLIIFFGGLVEKGWVKYVFYAQAVVILLVFLRKGWMAFLRSKFANLDLYAIRCALVGHFFMAVGMISDSIRTSDNGMNAFELTVLLAAVFFIAIAMLGTIFQGFVDSVRVLMNLKNKD